MSDRHVYTVDSRAFLEDVLGSVRLKRELEQGLVDPATVTGRVVGRCALAGPDVVRDALKAAAAAAPVWAASPLRNRLDGMARIREEIRLRHVELVDLLIAEGSPRRLAEWQVAGVLATCSEETLSWCAEQMSREFTVGPRRVLLRRVADGVVCVNPPQNAPTAGALFGCLALVAGNAVVIRAPRSAPLGVMHVLREIIAPVLADAGAPPGTLNVFCSRPGVALDAWIASPLVDDVLYVGGVERGQEIERRCVESGKKPILELSGNDCVVVWHDADLDLAVEALCESFYGSGQICMVPNQVVVHPRVADELLARLDTALADVRPGYPDEPNALLSPVLRTEKFFAFVTEALEHGARLVRGTRRLEVDGTPSETGMFLEPTVLRIDGLEGCRRIRMVGEETFFPLLPVVVPDDITEGVDEDVLLDRVIEFVNSNRYGLRNSLWSGDDRVVDEFVRRVGNGGILKVNDSHIGFVPYLPTHGGTGLTGGVFGEANYPALRTSHLQGVSIASGVRPSEAVFEAYRRMVGESQH
ncbi:aldehyde dehydrogenase [Actinophytocola xinjiangensis]|uniref:Aldehyde dehydrogenase n=1 Tax=Actinophytocola xinjiangensis TaxID=485602 RepID=A0A7Z0WT51_9PSEU|nr:aldehyde dehydrogenase [Actinophytocola xinjiangensis]